MTKLNRQQVPSSAIFKPPRCPWMLKCSPVFPRHCKPVTWLLERECLIFFFFPRRSLSICLIKLYPLASAHRRFLEPSHSQQTEKKERRGFVLFSSSSVIYKHEAWKNQLSPWQAFGWHLLNSPSGATAVYMYLAKFLVSFYVSYEETVKRLQNY